MTRHAAPIPATLGTLPALLALAQLGSAQTTIQILHASDLEGGVQAIQDAPRFAAVVQGLENAAVAAGWPSILLSAGDNYIPGPFYSAAGDPSLRTPLRTALGLPQVREREGRVDVALMNIVAFDASALGNHEFDPGTPAMREIIGPDVRDSNGDTILDEARWLGVDFPYLSANLDFSNDPSLASLFEPAIVPNTAFRGFQADLPAAATRKKLASATTIQRGNEIYGVVGATTPLLATISSPGLTTVRNPGAGTNEMTALATILQPVIDALLGQGVNKVILVTHLQQITLEQQLVPLLHGVDVAIAGGSDTLLADPTDILRKGDTAGGPYPIVATNADGDPAVIVSTAGQYRYVGRLVVTFDALGRVMPASVDPVVSGAYPADAAGVQRVWGNLVDPFLPGTKGARAQSLTDAVQAVVIANDGLVFGNSDVFLEGRRALVRTQETNLGNLSADANLLVARSHDPSTRVSLKNGGGIRDFIGAIDGETGALLPTQANPLSGKLETELSRLDIENSLRFNNGLSLLTVTAAGLVQILEHGVAATSPGATPGQFPQVGGLTFAFDPTLPAGSRLRSVAIKDESGAMLDEILRDGVLIGDSGRPIRMVTLNFLASGGDGYPFPALGTNRVDLLSTTQGGAATFANDGSEQDAFAEFLAARHPNSATAFDESELPVGQDGRIQSLAARTDTVAYPPPVDPSAPRMTFVGRYDSGSGQTAAEISAYDAQSRRLFVVNAANGTVEVVSLESPANPVLVATIDIAGAFSAGAIEASPNSVAVSDGLVAVAVQRAQDDNTQHPGLIAFYNESGRLRTTATVGALPDMLTFTPDGNFLVVANEGEPNQDYTHDPEGSVSIIYTYFVRFGLPIYPSDVRTARFDLFNHLRSELLAAGVRVYGPNASVAQDLEPEYVTISHDGTTAWVTLQENNAVAVVNLITARVRSIRALGYKDWSLSRLDPSDRDGAIRIRPWPVLGMYQPDAIASYRVGGTTYLVTANEGDARDFDAYAEEARVRDLVLDPGALPNAAELRANERLGRLTVTTALGDPDGDGDFDSLYTLGGRSFSIWRSNADGSLAQVFDSGDELELITASLLPARFNGDAFDTRSDNKGPEPEGLVLGTIGGRTYAFVGLERIGGIMMYDVTAPESPAFVQYTNSSDVKEGVVVGDISPEGLLFVQASDSPNGRALLVVSHEVSGTVTIYEVD
jgi:alkaline phosphatase